MTDMRCACGAITSILVEAEDGVIIPMCDQCYYQPLFPKVLDNLSEALGNSDGQTPDEIRQELKEDGLDVVSMEKRLLEYQKKIAIETQRLKEDLKKSASAECTCPAHGSDNECLYFKNGKCQHPVKYR